MPVTMGSLFDGIGGFPLAAMRAGITPVWASEIEPFPINVTKRHFPNVKHLGDIARINGAEIEPVDIITFGSPCQDLSVAGAGRGFSNECEDCGYSWSYAAYDTEDFCPDCFSDNITVTRSGLFRVAIKIIRAMREATDNKYPRFAVWENVPGAFSSNNGADFKVVLEEITETEISIPRSGKWASAGMVRSNSVDVAWRVLDAQYWGVPQRRKRIFLVSDFGGQCAAEILFKPESLPGYSAESESQGEGVAGSIKDCIEAADGCLAPWDVQSRRVHSVNGKWPALYGGEGGGHGYAFIPSIGFIGNQDGGDNITEKCPTLRADPGSGSGCKMAVCAAFKQGNSATAGSIGYEEEVSPTLTAGQSGTNLVPAIVFGADLSKKAEGIGFKRGLSACVTPGTHPGHGNHVVHPRITGTLCASGAGLNRPAGQGNETDKVICIPSNTDKLAVAQCLTTGTGRRYDPETETLIPAGYAVRRLTPVECERLQGFPDGWTDIPGASDTARYKALGNSVAVPCVQFIMDGIVRSLMGIERRYLHASIV